MPSISTCQAAVPPAWFFTYGGVGGNAPDPEVITTDYGPAFRFSLNGQGEAVSSAAFTFDAPLVIRVDLPEAQTLTWEEHNAVIVLTPDLAWGFPEPGETGPEWLARNTGRTVDSRGWFLVQLLTEYDEPLWVGLVVEQVDDTDRMRLAIFPRGPEYPAETGSWMLPAYFGPEDVGSLSAFYVKIERWGEGGTTTKISFSEDGATWDVLNEAYADVELWSTSPVYLGVSNNYSALNSSTLSVVMQPQEPVEHPGWDPGWGEDWDDNAPYDSDFDSNWDLDAIAPAVPQFGCDSVLSLVQQYSALIRRPVRIISGTEISLVDLDTEGIPTGFLTYEDKLYTSATKQVSAGAHTLSLDRADRTVTASAEFKQDDVRLLVSRHRVPQALPTFGGMPPAPVSRVSLHFDPEHFQASVEFWISDEGGE
ncbi:hypothetical protein [Lentzea terrae]|uniref:hypothetical protein n=1 Tax=Lentzea terrae TaxID=2200761 RepID=UPI0013009A1B|nr:hypothetical protein [Lentzea terrae]